ncbi:MAG: hypothetical protein JXB47_07085 [Anaerolineae bacterium]|nr:hypothetical protein [Anaerolineae bacterium]
MKTYTFHVSLPGTGRAWRKIEMRADQTLEDLHFAIQDAYEWDADHLYSFFMSGKAWDRRTEYSLPEGVGPYGGFFEDDEEWDDEDEEWDDEDEEWDAEDEYEDDEDDEEDWREPGGGLPVGPDEFALELLKLMAQGKSAEEIKSEARRLIGLGPDSPLLANDFLLDQLINAAQEMVQGISLEEIEGELTATARDVRTTKLEDLDLKPDQEFMYLFDYGDEWRFKVRVHAVDSDAPEDVDYPRIVQSVGEAPLQYPDWEDEDDEWDEEFEDEEDGYYEDEE